MICKIGLFCLKFACESLAWFHIHLLETILNYAAHLTWKINPMELILIRLLLHFIANCIECQLKFCHAIGSIQYVSPLRHTAIKFPCMWQINAKIMVFHSFFVEFGRTIRLHRHRFDRSFCHSQKLMSTFPIHKHCSIVFFIHSLWAHATTTKPTILSATKL